MVHPLAHRLRRGGAGAAATAGFYCGVGWASVQMARHFWLNPRPGLVLPAMTRRARSIHLTAGRQSLSCTAVVSLLLMLVAGCASSSAPKPDPSGADPLIEAQASEAHRLIS